MITETAAIRPLEDHVWTARESDAERTAWVCACGCTTIEYHRDNEGHIPVEQRKAEHLREVAAVLDGSVMDTVPQHHRYELLLRRRLVEKTPNEIAIWAIWMGGFAEIRTWNWNEAGLDEALAWIAEHRTEWRSDLPWLKYQRVSAEELIKMVHHGLAE